MRKIFFLEGLAWIVYTEKHRKMQWLQLSTRTQPKLFRGCRALLQTWGSGVKRTRPCLERICEISPTRIFWILWKDFVSIHFSPMHLSCSNAIYGTNSFRTQLSIWKRFRRPIEICKSAHSLPFIVLSRRNPCYSKSLSDFLVSLATRPRLLAADHNASSSFFSTWCKKL